MTDAEDAIAHAALALRVVRATELSKLPTQLIAEQVRAMSKSIGSEGLGAIFTQALTECVPALDNQTAALYAETFSVDELTAALEYHEGTHGRSFRKKALGLGPAMTPIMENVMEQVTKRADELLNSIGGKPPK